jgi:hypothetical protein
MRIPLTMRRGDTPIWDLAVVQSDGSPFNLTGCTVYFTAKLVITDADPGVFQLSSATAGVTITNAAGGLATIQPARGDTNTLTENTRLYVDVQVSRPGPPAETFTVWPTEDDYPGELIIVRDVTRAP